MKYIQSVQRAFDILEVLSDQPTASVSLGEIACSVGLRPATCAHLVATMADRGYVRESGADLVGIASVDPFSEAPPMRHPTDLLPGTRSVIVAVVRYPLDGVRRIGKPPAYALPSTAYSGAICRKLEDISLALMRWLEDQGVAVFSTPVTWPISWRVRPYEDMDKPLQAMFSHRHAAVAAGMGTFGNGVTYAIECCRVQSRRQRRCLHGTEDWCYRLRQVLRFVRAALPTPSFGGRRCAV